MAVVFFRQVWTLLAKNLRLVLIRHPLATIIRAFIIPIALFIFFTYAKYIFIPAAVYGIGSPRPLLTLPQALAKAASDGHRTVVFSNGGLAGGAIDAVIDTLVPVVEAAGSRAVRLDSDDNLDTVCRSSLRGSTTCYAAVSFSSSPHEGSAGFWKYTVRLDGAFGSGKINVNKDNNDGQVYALPLQHALDSAIALQNSSSGTGSALANANVYEFPFTSLTPDEREEDIRVSYQSSITKYLAVGLISGIIGICYDLSGFIATEREIGMASLIDAMMTTSHVGRRWGEAQVARMVANHLSFTLLYLPGWVVGSAVAAAGIYTTSNAAVIILYHVLVGIALTSSAIFGASFFRRAQLSGITVVLVFLVLAIISQIIRPPSTATVGFLSFFFAPCNYVFFLTSASRFERKLQPVDLLKVAPASPWNISGIVLWIFLIVQAVLYPVAALYVERRLHGNATTGRTMEAPSPDANQDAPGSVAAKPALQLDKFSKTYNPSFFRRLFGWVAKPPAPVHAVRELTLAAGRGQILVLLGANGSGKSTTLDAIAGTSRLTSGRILIDGTGGLGIAPQKNVLWDELTVEEHIRIFNRLKSPLKLATKKENRQLVTDVDLDRKVDALAKTLSGGQKRKLQLGMMLTGGSAVCCVDEVSSGLDPLSRRKIWDILLGERGRRTIIMTTHFLDEADLLSDHIAVLSKGTLRAEGSSAQLKDQLGGGYRIHVHKTKQATTGRSSPPMASVHSADDLPDVDGVAKEDSFDLVTYIAPSSALAANVIRALQVVGVADYRFSGPTLEDVFLKLAEEVYKDQDQDTAEERKELKDSAPEDSGITSVKDASLATEQKALSAKQVVVATAESGNRHGNGLQLMSGRQIGYWNQARVLFMKRLVIFKGNWFPSVAALLLPIIAAGLVTLFVQHQSPVGCSSADQTTGDNPETLAGSGYVVHLVAGPTSQFADTNALVQLFYPVFFGTTAASNSSSNSSSSSMLSQIFQNVTYADTYADFSRLVSENRKDILPAGFWLGDSSSPPTVAYLADTVDQVFAYYGQNFLNIMLANTSISASYSSFAFPWAPNLGDSLQLLVYVCLACSAYVGFFSLYPNLERRRNVRGLQYSNGVLALPLWLAYTAFDFVIVLVSSTLVVILFAVLSSVWYHVGYIFIIFTLYGLSSALLAYFISLFCNSQLAAYAFTATLQAATFLVYMIAYLCTLTYTQVNMIDRNLLIVHFIFSAVAPIGSIVRALFVSLNLFSVSCKDHELNTHPGDITLYGGPILYLILQTLAYFALLVWFDSGDVKSTMHRLSRKLRRTVGLKRPQQPSVRGTDTQDNGEDGSRALNKALEPTIMASQSRGDGDLAGGRGGLQVQNVTKTFGHNTAVENVTFGVDSGEVFALLGPNGAGKSTTISMIRGDIQPDDGDVFVEGASVIKQLAAVRANLGVCPQFDAIDQMTVREHLVFYARVRGIEDVEHNVQAVIRAVGLTAFSDRQAQTLSGGNKRKLSLGIALMGNPAVVLLDEPSSGLDAAAKRVMWKTLAAAVPGRSILLTTHSMEEADALAGRAGIVARRMLASGGTDELRAQFGGKLFVHLVCRGAPHTSEAEMTRLRQWVQTAFPGAEIEEKTYHGQMRFSVPVSHGRLTADTFGSENLSLSPSQSLSPSPSQRQLESRASTLAVTAASGGGDGDELHSRIVAATTAANASDAAAIGRVVVMLDEHREAHGINHFSVSPTTLDQVFLTIVGEHNVKEEGYHQEEEASKKKKRWWWPSR